MHLDEHYTNPRLVALYDQDNADRTDIEFYVALAQELKAQRIVDLGCGTGTLTCELALQGHAVIGVDPAPVMLAIARQKHGAEHVTWVEGNANALGIQNADLTLMTGNVAQVFLDDTEWQTTLEQLYAALRPGGYLAFESRNPLAREWEDWNPEATFECTDSPFGPLEAWLEVEDVQPGRVRMVGYNRFLATGELIPVVSVLRFRSHGEISASLRNARFTIEHVYGNWQRAPFTPTSRFMVYLAQR